MAAENCSVENFPLPVGDAFGFEKFRYFKLQVDSYNGKGGGLQHLTFLGSRLGGDIKCINKATLL